MDPYATQLDMIIAASSEKQFMNEMAIPQRTDKL